MQYENSSRLTTTLLYEDRSTETRLEAVTLLTNLKEISIKI